jgi:hypothetical protein
MNEQKKYTLQVEPITTSCSLEAGCNEILFINKQTEVITCFVNNFPLAPGEFFGIPGNAGEIDATKYKIDIAAGGRLWILKKNYL